MKKDAYLTKYLLLLKKCSNDEDKKNLINKIYQGGFEDGHNESGINI
jgi:hypothetical protein